MTRTDQYISAKAFNMSVVCAILVVIIHSPQCHDFSSVSYLWTGLVQLGLCQIAVPYFFMAAGYFLAKHIVGDNWWRIEVRKRIGTLLIPFFVWNFVFSFLLILVQGGGYNWKGWILFAFRTLGIVPFGGLNLGALWFVRSLFAVVLLSGVLYYCIKRWHKMVLLILFALYALTNPYPFEGVEGVVWFAPFRTALISTCGIFWFAMGMHICIASPELLLKRSIWPGIVGIGLLVGRCLAVRSHAGWPWGCYLGVVAIPFVLAGVWACMPRHPWPRWITSMSFPLYILHGFFNLLVRPFRPDCFWLSDLVPAAIVNILGSIAIVCGCRYILPRWLFGGR